MTRIVFTTGEAETALAGHKTQIALPPAVARGIGTGDTLWVAEPLVEYVHKGARTRPEFPGRHACNVRQYAAEAMIELQSRLSIVVESVRAARAHDLTAADALAEGILRDRLGDVDGFVSPDDPSGVTFTKSARVALGMLWNKKHHGICWEANPAVTVLCFRLAGVGE